MENFLHWPLGAALIVGYIAVLRIVVELALSPDRRFPEFFWRGPERLFTFAIVGFFLFMAAASIGRPVARIDLKSLDSSLALYMGIVVFVFGFLIYRNNDPRTAFGLNWKGWGAGWKQVLIAILVVLPPIYGAQWLGYSLSPSAEPQPIVTFLLESTGWRERAAVIAIAVFAAPLTEELVFRGCLYGVVRQSFGRYAALAVSAIIFALIHAHLPSVPGLIILAVALSLLYESTGSLWAPIALHAAFNGISICGAIFWPEFMR